MKPSIRIVNPLLRFALGSLCRIDYSELSRVPRRGPLIIATNHINFLEVPLIYTYLHPRRIVGIVKRETWDNPILGALATIWEAIPIDREATDMSAMRLSLAALAQGRILALAPEGTRSGDGKLQKGHGGIVQLAVRSGVTILPVVHFGGERFWDNLHKPRRTRVTFHVGEPFRVSLPEGTGLTKSVREATTDEIMRRLARLLPPSYRGVYSEGLDEPDRHLVPAI